MLHVHVIFYVKKLYKYSSFGQEVLTKIETLIHMRKISGYPWHFLFGYLVNDITCHDEQGHPRASGRQPNSEKSVASYPEEGGLCVHCKRPC